MSKKKKKITAADNLIESLMDDLKDIQAGSSIHSGLISDLGQSSAEGSSGVSAFGGQDHRVDGTNPSADLWKEFDLGDVVPHVEGQYQGPSADTGYQSPADVISPISTNSDQTVSIQQDLNLVPPAIEKMDSDKTLAVEGFANARVSGRRIPEADVKVSVGQFRGGRGSSNVMTSVDASLAQAENLKFAQQRIWDLENEVEQLRGENEELASAGEIIRSRMDDLSVRISKMEKEKVEIQETAQSEMLILKGNLQYKENEVAKARIKVEELETRLKSDFKKIRVRERELENRLELLRAEKSALVRSKDEYILEQKRKIDQLSQELDNYRRKCLELNKTIESNQDQVKRTERALRLALTNLEANEENLVPLKKAE